MLQWQKGIVEKVLDETYNTRRYFIRLPEVHKFSFRAGQFVTLDLPIAEKPAARWRSYSIASAPSEDNVIELLIVLLEGGAGSTYIFNEIKEGSEFVVRGPQGVFTLPESIESDLFFICTGTGIAPFRSMLNNICANQIPYKDIFLIFGCRTQKDLLYHQEMKVLGNRLSGFRYMPTLSRESWEGNMGYVHSIYEDILAQKRTNGTEIHPAHFYLCGWKFMIDDARKKIAELGYDRKSIHFELYG